MSRSPKKPNFPQAQRDKNIHEYPRSLVFENERKLHPFSKNFIFLNIHLFFIRMFLPLKFTLTPPKHFDNLKIQSIIAFTGMAFVIALISLLTNGIPETTITVNHFLAILGSLTIMTMLILKWLHELKNSNSNFKLLLLTSIPILTH